MQIPRAGKWTALAALLVVAAAVAWYLASPLFIVTRGDETVPQGFTTVVLRGTFVDGEPGHRASGQVLILTDGTSFVARLANVSVTNGPDIHVFLAKGARVTAGDVDLGSVRAMEGSSNYAVSGGVDPRTFAYVVIWCVPFSVQFGYAALAPP